MDGAFRGRYRLPDLALTAAVAVLIAVLVLASARGGSGELTASATIDAAVVTRAVPAGFLGLSIEYSSLEAYAGGDPSKLNPVFVQLVRNLAPRQSPVVRIGGKSADTTWWPTSGITQPAGVSYSLTDNWIAVASALRSALKARLMLGINLAANNTELAAAEANALLNGIGANGVLALEIGNEPELYGTFAWYRTGGQAVSARPAAYDYATFQNDFTSYAAALPDVPLAGPTFGNFAWTPHVPAFLAAEPSVRILTLHRYPLQKCFIGRGSPRYPSIGNLLAPAASTGLAARFAPFAATARARGLPLRLDELNTVSCGADRPVSQTFAAALWAVDALFSFAQAGVAGVNMHTFPGAGYELFRFSHAAAGWRAWVSPEYYGLLLFAQAAPAGSKLLAVSASRSSRLRVWATLGRDRRIRVVALNKDRARAGTVRLRLAGAGPVARVERLLAPSAEASSGVTLGGQSFGLATASGTLPAPLTSSLSAVRGTFQIRLPAASAALLTVDMTPSAAR